MKYIIVLLVFITGTHAFGQIKVTQGSNSVPFNMSKKTYYTAFSNESADYFVESRVEQFVKIHTLTVADKSGKIMTSKEVRIGAGMSNNSFDVKNLLVVGNSPYIFVENHVKATGKNTFSARAIDNSGNVSTTNIVLGSLDFLKASNSGDWYAAVAPDRKSMAVIGISAYEKSVPQQINYHIFDEQLKETSKGTFSFTGNTGRLNINQFMVSNTGTLYLVSEDYDKTYTYPIVYKYAQGAQPLIIPVMMPEPNQKNLNYTFGMNPAGDLIIGGYIQKKTTFSAGDVQAIGTYLFSSAKPSEIKTSLFEKPITNLVASEIVYNGDTFFLLGEQIKLNKQTGSTPATDVYEYSYENIMVTAYTNELTKKFEMPVSRKWKTTDFHRDLKFASGIINNKLTLIFNDEYTKHINDQAYKGVKLPIGIQITNDGLMEAPVTFVKELDLMTSSYVLCPGFFSYSNGRLVLLSSNEQTIKTSIFQ